MPAEIQHQILSYCDHKQVLKVYLVNKQLSATAGEKLGFFNLWHRVTSQWLASDMKNVQDYCTSHRFTCKSTLPTVLAALSDVQVDMVAYLALQDLNLIEFTRSFISLLIECGFSPVPVLNRLAWKSQSGDENALKLFHDLHAMGLRFPYYEGDIDMSASHSTQARLNCRACAVIPSGIYRPHELDMIAVAIGSGDWPVCDRQTVSVMSKFGFWLYGSVSAIGLPCPIVSVEYLDDTDILTLAIRENKIPLDRIGGPCVRSTLTDIGVRVLRKVVETVDPKYLNILDFKKTLVSGCLHPLILVLKEAPDALISREQLKMFLGLTIKRQVRSTKLVNILINRYQNMFGQTDLTLMLTNFENNQTVLSYTQKPHSCYVQALSSYLSCSDIAMEVFESCVPFSLMYLLECKGKTDLSMTFGNRNWSLLFYVINEVNGDDGGNLLELCHDIIKMIFHKATNLHSLYGLVDSTGRNILHLAVERKFPLWYLLRHFNDDITKGGADACIKREHVQFLKSLFNAADSSGESPCHLARRSNVRIDSYYWHLCDIVFA